MPPPARVLVTHATEFLGKATTSALLQSLPASKLFCQDARFADEGERSAFVDGLDVSEDRLEFISHQDVGKIAEAVQFDVDILVNNTAYPAVRRKFHDIPREEFVQTLDALTVFPFELTAKLLPAMRERKRGKVIFVTSATAFHGLPNYASYAIARGATNAMALTLAKEVGPDNICVNAVCPNFVESETYFPKRLRDDPKILAKITKPIPLGRLAKPHEPADLIAFLASSKADYITGQIMPFAGGWA
ncbi:Dehydrogenase/reductase SDR family member 4 [Hondaea fermentalgiana]|uniref:3-oxoacyl-[acyl-carrier-protein] reductase n=1 Tax=Hondaea fermentalgiana TaxID=2315210 RepID=A0A2R5G2S1_9STRA|nr:Dehydrogenase/reductase SDR family member 4 [Hondaea fermentalgiana]|eukprot:GBG24028.1 Dehydrogenase/reductase SDR family member 4 [Hondaea fermentalgiana]